MKKLFVFLILVTLIFCAVSAILPASAESVKITTDLAVDTNVYKGDYIKDDSNPVDSVIVWVDVKEKKFNESFEYGTFIYSACKDIDIVFENGAFNPADSGKSSFATCFDVTRLVKGVEYAVKAYVKSGDTIELSKTTAYFNVNDNELKTFDIVIHGPDIIYEAQESVSNYAQNQTNTQYFVYRDDVLMGATNELNFNVVDDLFDENGDFEETSYNITVKTVSGLNNGGQSNPYSFEMQTVEDEESFLQNVGVSENENVPEGKDPQDPKNVYQVLTSDIDLTGLTYRSCSIEDGSWKKTDLLHCVIQYFADTLDAKGHKITLNFDCATQSREGSPEFAGLFGKVCKTGYIRNLNYEMTAKYDFKQTNLGGERACAFTMVGWGTYDNCFMTAQMQSLNDLPDEKSNSIRRDAFIGFPGNYYVKNVIANIKLLDSTGALIGDVRTHDGSNGHYGTLFHWEGIQDTEADHLVYVSPVTMGPNNSIGPKKGKNLTFYNSFSDFLTGTNGINLDQDGLSSMDKGEYREDVVYNTGWDKDIWEFNAEEGYIKFFGNVVYQSAIE